MAIVKVITANNVEIEYEVAGIGDRAIATLIDWVIMFAYFFICFRIINSNPSLKYGLSFMIQLLIYLPVFLYHVICEMFLEGQSFGKKIMQIRVVMMDAGRPAFVNYFLRWIITPVEFSFGGAGVVALISVAANGKGQRLADMAAGTTVIRLKPKTNIQEAVFAPKINPDYVVQFPEAINLTDRDLTLIKQVRRQIYRKSYEDANYFAEKTKDSICAKLGIQSDLDGISFIDTILKDNQYQVIERG